MPIRRVEPRAQDWKTFSWSSGTFDTARRRSTREVEGTIAVPHHLILVTLTGGAKLLEVRAECGHRYAGEDFAGSVSFVPAGCERQLAMRDVSSAWASISVRPDLLDGVLADSGSARSVEIPSFTNARDPLVHGVLSELARLRHSDELDAGYCEAMTIALAHHLGRRYGSARPTRAAQRLTAWRLRKIDEYIAAHLDRHIQVRELAELTGLSIGHFHRSLRATTGQSPLELVQLRRVERARLRLLEGAAIAQLSHEVGFASTSHFARTFRRWTGVTPQVFRSGRRARR